MVLHVRVQFGERVWIFRLHERDELLARLAAQVPEVVGVLRVDEDVYEYCLLVRVGYLDVV